MKKSLFFAAVAALLALSSCDKESTKIEFIGNDPVFKARIATTRTAIDGSNGNVSWVEGDEVSITDNSSHTVKYVATDVSSSSATLVKKAGEKGTLNPEGPYTAIYGTAPSTSQTYTGSVPSLPMTAETNNGILEFRVTCGLLKLTLTQADESIKTIAVSDGNTTYTLSCYPSESIATGKTFYIALPAANYTSIVIKDANNKLCSKKIIDDLTFTISNNEIRPLYFNTGLTFDEQYSYPAGTLNGVFSISATKQVRFSKGNLQYQASGDAWRFAEHQYDFIGPAAGNTTVAADRATQAAWIDLFGWGATGVNLKKNVPPYCVTRDYSDYSSLDGVSITRDNKGDWGVCMGPDWHMLTISEWSYVVNNHTHLIGRINLDSEHFVYGLMLMPDNWTGGNLTSPITLAAWTTLEQAGGVFFPCAGLRGDQQDGLIVKYTSTDQEQGYYWSSVGNGNSANVMLLKLDRTCLFSATNEKRNGASVRLVVDN